MSDWKTIEEFPNYEITKGGVIREKGQRQFVPTYQGRVKVGGAIFTRARLKRNGIFYPVTVRDIAAQTWMAEEPKKPPVKKKRPNVTPDGKDLSQEEWRRIPGFWNYQITRDGYVRHRDTKKLIVEQVTKANRFYSLYIDSQKFSRGKNGLIYAAFPELLNRWAEVPSYPGYRVTEDGRVMGPRWEILPLTPSGSVQLRKDKKRHTVKPKDLALEAWGRYVEKEEA